MTQKERSKLLARCNDEGLDGGVDVIVCSDGMSREVNLKRVGLVVNYDVPSFSKTYVHRVGRTAKAEGHFRAISSHGEACGSKGSRRHCEDIRGMQLEKDGQLSPTESLRVEDWWPEEEEEEEEEDDGSSSSCASTSSEEEEDEEN